MGQSVSVASFRRVGEDEPHASRKSSEPVWLLSSDRWQRQACNSESASRNSGSVWAWYSPLLLDSVFGFRSVLRRCECVEDVRMGIFLVAYCFGGTVNHALSLANHELSHNLAFSTPRFNEILAIFRHVSVRIVLLNDVESFVVIWRMVFPPL